jgi:hypothetical protein
MIAIERLAPLMAANEQLFALHTELDDNAQHDGFSFY